MIILRAEDKPDLDGGCKCSVIYDSPVILDGGSLDSVDTYVVMYLQSQQGLMSIVEAQYFMAHQYSWTQVAQ